MDEPSEDEEEFIPKCVHDVKTGCTAEGSRATTLVLVEWEDYRNDIDFT